MNHVDDLFAETPRESQTSNELGPSEIAPQLKDCAEDGQRVDGSGQWEDLAQSLDRDGRVDRRLLECSEVGAYEAHLVEEAEREQDVLCLYESMGFWDVS